MRIIQEGAGCSQGKTPLGRSPCSSLHGRAPGARRARASHASPPAICAPSARFRPRGQREVRLLPCGSGCVPGAMAAATARASNASTERGDLLPACQAFKRPLALSLWAAKPLRAPAGARGRRRRLEGHGEQREPGPRLPVVLAGAVAAANKANTSERVRISSDRDSLQTALAASPRRVPPNVARLARPRGEAEWTATARSAQRRRGRDQGTVMGPFVMSNSPRSRPAVIGESR